MKTKTLCKTLIYVMIALFFGFIAIFESAYLNVRAEETSKETTYSDVLEDLQKDETFNADDYPIIEDDYSLQVIQIAESTDNELLVYVYQPSQNNKKLLATSIRFSTTLGENAKWLDYNLTLISENGVFCKYCVEDFSISTSVMRFYDIVGIYRAWDSTIDDPSGNDNTISEIGFSVGQFWTVCTLNDTVYYSCETSEVITITNKWVSFIRYQDNYNWFGKSCDAHFVAFSTDMEIESLMSADVSFDYRSVYAEYNAAGFGTYDDNGMTVIQTNRYTYGDWQSKMLTLDASKEAIFESGGIFNRTYTWDRIQTVEEFISNHDDLTDSTKEQLRSEKWVLNFFETDYTFKGAVNLGFWSDDCTRVKDVSILRLEFTTKGEYFNLGVVDNKQTGSTIPGNNPTTEIDDFIEQVEKILTIFIVVVLCGLLLFFVVYLLPIVIKAITSALQLLWNGLCKLISLPGELIDKIFKRKK